MQKLCHWVCLLSAFSSASALERVGMVSAVDGNVKAVDAMADTRIVQPYADIYLGDAFYTGEKAKLEVQFTDGSLLLLTPDSHFTIDAYEASRIWGRNEFGVTLHAGGARLATGFIANKKPEHFKFNTPNASIGVRGTLFETRMDGGNLFVGATFGDLTLSNNVGSIAIGTNQEYQFASISSQDGYPQTLEERPPQLELNYFSPPNGGAEFDTGSAVAADREGGRRSRSYSEWGSFVTALVVIGVVVGATATAAVQSAGR